MTNYLRNMKRIMNPGIFLLVCSMVIFTNISRVAGATELYTNPVSSPTGNFQDEKLLRIIDGLSTRLEKTLQSYPYLKARIIADSLSRILDQDKNINEKYLARPYYFIGATYAVEKEYITALKYFGRALELVKKYPDEMLEGRIYYMMSYSASSMGDYIKAAEYIQLSIGLKKKQYGENNTELVTEYISSSNQNMGIRNYEKSLEDVNEGLRIANAKPDSVEKENISLLYESKGTVYMYLADYRQAIHNLEKALEVYQNTPKLINENYINVLDKIGTCYYYLRSLDKCSYFYLKAISSGSEINGTYINLCNNYAIILGKQKKEAEGEKILASVLKLAKKSSAAEIKNYYDLLRKYAEYLREYKIDLNKACKLYLECYGYIANHSNDIVLNNEIAMGYALTLMDSCRSEAALDSVQSLIIRNCRNFSPHDVYLNPSLDNINPDKIMWEMLGAKYRILRKLYSENKRFEVLESAAKTAEFRISVFEQIRINIGEEESRLLLGNSNRDSYLDGIQSYYLCYTLTGKPQFLEMAFELSEKSKAASLLASTREIKAIKFHVPEEMATLENSLQQEVSFYNAKLTAETNNPDYSNKLVNLWRDKILQASFRRDTLIKYFERNYPGYYSLKYNTQVIKTDEITNLLGRQRNYISYIVSDTSLYILLINGRYKELITRKIGPDFFSTITKFRRLLSEPDIKSNAGKEFNEFQECGYKLYDVLIKPVKKFFISDNIIISPDNVLAYFPFEVIVTDSVKHENNYYNKLSYLMNDYQISYAYSATFLSESVKTKRSFFNKTVSFAPSYSKLINVDSLYVKRQTADEILPDLKYAREEATFVARLTSGKLYVDTLATESRYKADAGTYDIIHLAMHTLMKDNDPLNSGLIFSIESDSSGDRSLGTYEITGVPLKAKMVVLSSCYTGTGEMYQGEGVLSLARGFIFSGSQSVVMSLWEVNDRSGTDIIKYFYRNIKAGYSKSNSLRMARIKYLKGADQLRSHPFFWSTLIVYGDDSPLYYSPALKFGAISGLLFLMFSGFIYFRKR
jgi:CHAT domain-containing protein